MNRIEPLPWRGVSAIEKLILVALPVAAVVVMSLPFLDQVIVRRLARLPGARPFVVWLVNGANSWIAGAALLGLGVLFALFVRYRLTSNKRLWSGNGCPECQERELVRVSRKMSDRFYRLLGVPAYRYACRNCTWRGLRVARRDYSPERLAELEASLTRFDPDNMQAMRGARDGDSEASDDSLVMTPPPDSSSMFFDPGDVSRVAISRDILDDNDLVDEMIESSMTDNHSANGESTDGMEWLWRRSSD